MSELKSKCCGVECYRLIDVLVTDDDFYRAVGQDQYMLRCSACNCPIEVEEKDHDEEWKNARDEYSGVREEE